MWRLTQPLFIGLLPSVVGFALLCSFDLSSDIFGHFSEAHQPRIFFNEAVAGKAFAKFRDQIAQSRPCIRPRLPVFSKPRMKAGGRIMRFGSREHNALGRHCVVYFAERRVLIGQRRRENFHVGWAVEVETCEDVVKPAPSGAQELRRPRSRASLRTRGCSSHGQRGRWP